MCLFGIHNLFSFNFASVLILLSNSVISNSKVASYIDRCIVVLVALVSSFRSYSVGMILKGLSVVLSSLCVFVISCMKKNNKVKFKFTVLELCYE